MARKKIDYTKLTLDQLADLHDADDEEIEEDEAFNSDDERQFGKYFDSNQQNNAVNISNNSYLGLTVPLMSGDEGKGCVQNVITKGHKMVLSSLCLDVPSGDFRQIKLMVRCIYLGGTDEPWLCLANFLGQKNGGMAIPSSVPNNLEAIGPCKVEWKIEGKIPSSLTSGGINIFGKIVPISEQVFSDDDISVDYAGAFMSSDDEECGGDDEDEEKVVSTAEKSVAVNSEDKTDDREVEVNPKKRKFSNDEDVSKEKTAEKPSPSNSKLTKKERKQLAKEKAQQLEDTLSAARKDEAGDEKSSKKKKKKKNQTTASEIEELSRPTSLTRERRLPSGVTVRDLLVGTGAPVKSGKKITLHYTGSLRSSGKVFDKNHSKQHPLVFRQGTGEVIRGLERGLEGMKVGGERVLHIPSKLAYGEKGAGDDIPPDSDLTFEVKLLKVG
jgi:FKBP-type peptidyl-prolyl cis-trans isomerase